MYKYKVGIITPCYNVTHFDSNKEDLFEKNIESILNQTIGYSNIEHILIDDGSIDNTYNILKDLSRKYENIKVYHFEKNNGGPSIPRNKGIKKADAEYLLFLDSDDTLESDALEFMYNEFVENDVDIVCSNFYSFDGENLLKHKTKNANRKLYTLRSPDLMDCTSTIPLIKRKFLIDNDIFFKESYAEDSKFYMDCILNTKKPIIVLNDKYFKTYISDNSTSLSHGFTKKQINDLITVHSDCLDEFMRKNMHETFIKEYYYSNTILIIGTLIRLQDDVQKKSTINLVKSYLVKYSCIPLELPIYWKMFYYMILWDMKYTLIISSKFVNNVFEQQWFKKIFRNKNYK